MIKLIQITLLVIALALQCGAQGINAQHKELPLHGGGVGVDAQHKENPLRPIVNGDDPSIGGNAQHKEAPNRPTTFADWLRHVLSL